MSSTRTTISPELLAIIVCPIDKQPVKVDGGELVCTVCGRRFQIENGIPNMLVEEE